ncbi:11681_t:CDS:2 [Ambispora leptoticha]|uniref:11681_t:CDS:1 n=1 Tax=Ambispora leptoticha TaxID=144679 RepID=A0A9N9D106_9GLOM|nr:11681_t:CDS:2 [Ambispora leptoticha]
MSSDDDDFIVISFNMLPAEKLNPQSPGKVKEQKKKSHELIVTKSNWNIVNSEEAQDLIKKVGSDIIINSFACNFKVDGELDKDVNEANFLNRRLSEKFSLTSYKQHNKDKPLTLSSTMFKQSDYGDCPTNFKNRLGLKGDQDLYVINNVDMTPWSTELNFITKLTKAFKEALEELVKLSIKRNTKNPNHPFHIPSNEKIYNYTIHPFFMQGTNEICLTHLSLFQLKTHHQVIIKVKIPEKVMKKYRELHKKDPLKVRILCSQDGITVNQIATEGNSFMIFITETFNPYVALKNPTADLKIQDNIIVKYTPIDPWKKFYDKLKTEKNWYEKDAVEESLGK